ncbi:MAG TPA: 2,3-bisphosphoglycerate-independent phosphoglycerate mutase [Gammaproteobacteria bacterium]|jgi:2,3-bisphosphoglycerate-independent phosphoglycerate mutase|nr:2,3-bisphosphoglycerate-independent phosphoglycerate mutase [Gammaproteobacteria bacterium]
MKGKRHVPRRSTILLILDGFGLNPAKKNNAVYEANTPRLDEYFSRYAHTAIAASGRQVGLPTGQFGNSEVGHSILGCGSILRQDLVRIDDSIKDGSFTENTVLLDAAHTAFEANRPLHLLGLVSDGGVHSHCDHLAAMIKMCRKNDVKPVLHMISDGRDTGPKSALKYLPALQKKLEKAGGHVATVVGRYYAMDRDRRWERTKVAWDLIINGVGKKVDDVSQGIMDCYDRGITDEFLEPMLVKGSETMKTGDSVLFFNFRNDRPRQLSEALAFEEFEYFDRGEFEPVELTCLTEYDTKLLAPIVFPPERPKITLTKAVSFAGYKQFHCAETEKYAHVTYFFNGGREQPYAGEDRVMVASPAVDTYDEAPEMSAEEVADATIEAIESEEYGFIIVNFANGDMVGHTAIADPIIKAIEFMDAQVGRVLDAAVKHEYSVVLTSDHGNCDEYIDPFTGDPHTQHTPYPVPLMIVDPSYWHLETNGGLSNVAPTVLQLMGLQIPEGMQSESLLLGEVGAIK